MRVVPDKGWAWLVCAGGTLWNIVSGGSYKISGILFVEYKDLFNEGAAATSGITFTQGIMALSMAPIGGYLSDKLPHNRLRVMLATIFALCALSVAMAGYMPNLSLTILTYGAMLGSGLGLSDPAVLALPSNYFIEKRTIAYGITFTGNSIGTLIFPLFFATTVDYVGFRGAMLIFSGIWLQCLLIPAIAWPLDKSSSATSSQLSTHDGRTHDDLEKRMDLNMEPLLVEVENGCLKHSMTERVQDTDSKVVSPVYPAGQSWQDDNKPVKCKAHCLEVLNIFREYINFLATPNLPFLLLSIFFGLMGYFNSFFILPPLARELGMSKLRTSMILIMSSVIEIASKLVIGVVVDRCNVSKGAVLLVSYAVTGGVGVIVSFLDSSYALYCYGLVVGAFGGAVVGLGIPMMINIVSDDKKGTASGMYPLFIGTATAVGPIILGSIAEYSGSYTPCLRACACAYLAGIICYLGTFCSSTKTRFYRRKSAHSQVLKKEESNSRVTSSNYHVPG